MAVGGATDDLDGGLALGDLDLCHAQAIGVRMLLGLEHARDRERAELLGRIVDAFDLEADRRQLGLDLIERGCGVEVILKPGEREFHGSSRTNERSVANRNEGTLSRFRAQRVRASPCSAERARGKEKRH